MFQLPLNPDGLFFVVSPPFPFFIPPLFCFLCFNVSFALSCFFSPFFLPRCVSFSYLPLSIFPFTCLSLYQSLTSACPSPLVFLQLSFFISYAYLIFLFPLEPTWQLSSSAPQSFLSHHIKLLLLFLSLFFLSFCSSVLPVPTTATNISLTSPCSISMIISSHKQVEWYCCVYTVYTNNIYLLKPWLSTV